MENFIEYIDAIENIEHREKFRNFLTWMIDTHPELETRFAWKQPMFTYNGTFIIGFSVAKNHFSVAPEILELFIDDVKASNYSFGKKLFQIKWNEEINYSLIDKIIKVNIEEKKDMTTFWRK